MDLWNKVAGGDWGYEVVLEQHIQKTDQVECNLCGEGFPKEERESVWYYITQAILFNNFTKRVEIHHYCGWCSDLLEEAERKYYRSPQEFVGYMVGKLTFMSLKQHQETREQWLQQPEGFRASFKRRWSEIVNVLEDQDAVLKWR